MERIFGRPIVTQEEMRARIRELGKQITTDYTGKDFVEQAGSSDYQCCHRLCGIQDSE